MPQYFDMLDAQIPAIRQLQQKPDATGFFIQEVLRFYSLAGTMLEGANQPNGFQLDTSSSVDERYLTHVLTRSMLEPFFVILYIFFDLNDLKQINTRYEQQKNTFKDEYRKLMNGLSKPKWQGFMQKHGSKLEPVDPNWSRSNKLPDVNSMLLKLKNKHGSTLEDLYPLYRITSFDTHGRSLGTIFESVFGKQCNFPVLDIKYAIELMANEYFHILNTLRQKQLI